MLNMKAVKKLAIVKRMILIVMGVSQVQKGVKRQNFLELFSTKRSSTKNGKRSGPSFHQFLEISIVLCALSARKLSCGHQGAADIRDHISTQSHQKLAKSMSSQSRLSFASSNPLSDQVGLHINR